MNATETGSPTEDQAQDQQPPADQGQQAQGQQAQDQQAQDDHGEQAHDSYRPQFDYRQGAPLYRPYEGRMIAGVAGGIAQYLNVDPTIVRIVLAVLTVAGGAGIPVYVAGWLLMPDEGATQSLASELIDSLQGRSN